MKLYLAPMEGITGSIVRNAFYHNFGCIDKYFTPFIPAAKRMSPKIKRDIEPENNKGIQLVPQLISNNAPEIPDMIRQLKDYGYSEFNINLGCPSGTVTGKKRGSGMLLYPEELDRFLDEIYESTDEKISVKTRIGFNSPEEWPHLLDIYSRYPMHEFIIHPRVRQEFYTGVPHMEAFELAYTSLVPVGMSLCYNGDVWTTSVYKEITEKFPEIDSVMIGRGLLARPDLCCRIKGIELANTRQSIRDFCNEIYEEYCAIFSGEKDAVCHMKEIWANLGRSFSDSDKLLKKLLKAREPSEFKIISSAIFDTCELTER